jgi:hypothetical protein
MDFAGIFYRLRYGHSLENWTLFEPFPLGIRSSTALSAKDPDFLEALRLHGIHIG